MKMARMATSCGLLVLLVGGSAVSAEKEPAVAAELRTDYRLTPIGLDRLPPRLFWRIDADGRSGVRQTAYQVQAGLDRDTLANGVAVWWDSGKIESSETTQIAYAGPKPVSRQRIFWRVKVWDEQGVSGGWSEPTWFETGLLVPTDWQKAEWIGCNRNFKAPELAPDGVMGEWIAGPAGQACRGFFRDVVLPDKLVVSAMAWWGLDRSLGTASVVANFDSSTPAEQSAMVRAGHGSNGGFLDLGFYLRSGQTNRVELKFRRPVPDVAATMGMRMVFADGEEILLRSGADWLARPAGESAATVPVKGGGALRRADVRQSADLAADQSCARLVPQHS